MLIKSCPGRSPKLDVIRDKRQSTKIVKKDCQMRAQRVTDKFNESKPDKVHHALC